MYFQYRNLVQNPCHFAENVRRFAGHFVVSLFVFINILALIVLKLKFLSQGGAWFVTFCCLGGLMGRHDGQRLDLSRFPMGTAFPSEARIRCDSIHTNLGFVKKKVEATRKGSDG